MALVDTSTQVELEMESTEDELHYRYNSATLALTNIEPRKVETCALIGQGEFGSIHRGMLHTDRGSMRDVTVFWLQSSNSLTANQLHSLVKDLEIGVQVGVASTHISLYGISYANEASLVILDPLWEPDLRSVLRESRSARFASENLRSASFLSAERLFSMMKDICQGAEALVSKHFYPRSLCTANVLVGERGHVKICGFGLADYRSLTTRRDERLPNLTRWNSPRQLKSELQIDAADIAWTLGVVLWEIATLGGTPYARVKCDDEIRVRVPAATARLDYPAYIGVALKELLEDCLAVDADCRLGLTSILKRLDCLAVDAQVLYLATRPRSYALQKQLLLVLPFSDPEPDNTPRSTTTSLTFEYAPIVRLLE